MSADRPATPSVAADLDGGMLRSAAVSARLRVSEFLAGSERVFLETGEALDVLRGQATTLVATSVSVAEGARTADDQPVDGLAHGCREMDQHLGVTQKVLAHKAQRLRAVLSALDRLASFRLLFRRAGSALRMLGMSTEIENARGGKESTGFATVAGDVRRLGGLIESKLDGVLGEALLMRRTAEDALARVTDMTVRQDGRTSAMLTEAAAGLESLRDLARAAAELGTSSASVSREVVDHVGRVVVSMQSHDITRQMMEHVVEGLAEIEADLDASAAPAPRPGARAAAGVVEREPPDVADLADLGRLQSSQLRQARQQLEGSLHEMPTSLRAMSAATHALAQSAKRLAQGQEGGASLEEVERGVELASGALREQLQYQAEIERAMEKVLATIGDMLKRLRDVERIGKELKIIGLNAGVEAAKNTNGGRVMSVLARTIQELSTEVGDHTKAFATVVHEIASQASARTADGGGEDAGNTAEPAAGSDAGEGDQIVRELEGRVVELRAYSDRLSGAIESMAAGAAAMGQAVDEITARMRGQQDAMSALLGAEADLEAASAALSPPRRERGGEGVSQRVRDATARYTIDAERKVHRSVLGGAVPGPARGPAKPGGGGGSGGAGGDSGLGDNVELF